jgi:hypothetical protein
VHKAGANKQAHPAGNGKEWNSSRKVAHDGRGFENTIPHWPGQSSHYEADRAQKKAPAKAPRVVLPFSLTKSNGGSKYICLFANRLF